MGGKKELEVENPQRGRGEALAKAIAKKANRKTNSEQQDFYLGLLMELERSATAAVEAGPGAAEGVGSI